MTNLMSTFAALALIFMMARADGPPPPQAGGGDLFFEGDGTMYNLDDPTHGNCNLMSYPDDAKKNYAAVNTDQFQGTKNCGRCGEVQCVDEQCAGKKGAKQIVYFVDQCPGCALGDLDLSPHVFEAITGSTPSRLKIRWRYVDCPVQSKVKYCLKSGSNQYWLAIQPTNNLAGIKNVTINGQATKMVDSAYYFLLDGKSQVQTDLSKIQVKLTAVSGEEITDTISLTSGNCTEGTAQFSSGHAFSDADRETPKPKPKTEAPAANASATPNATTVAPSATLGATTQPPPSSHTGSSQGTVGVTPTIPVPSTDQNDTIVFPFQPQQQQQDAGNEVKTNAEHKSSATSPAIIAMAVVGSIGFVALVVLAVKVKLKKIQDKRDDRLPHVFTPGGSIEVVYSQQATPTGFDIPSREQSV